MGEGIFIAAIQMDSRTFIAAGSLDAANKPTRTNPSASKRLNESMQAHRQNRRSTL